MSLPTVALPPFRGLAKDYETGTLLPGQSPDMQDIRLTIRREIEKMDGYAAWNTNQNPEGAVEIKGGFDYQKWDTITRRVVVGTKTKLYAFSQKKNELTANQSDVETDTTGFAAIGAGTITRDTDNYYQGVASLKVVTGATSGDGGKIDAVSASAATQYTASCYVKGTSGDVIKFVFRDNTNGTETSTTKTMTGKWQRVSVSHTMGASAVTDLEFHMTNNAAVTKTFYCDAFMVEANSYVGHWTRGGDSGWTSLLTSTTALDREFWDFEYCDDLLVACNGLDKPYFWDGLRTAMQTVSGDVWETFGNMPTALRHSPVLQLSHVAISTGGISVGVSPYLTASQSYEYFSNKWKNLSSAISLARDESAAFSFPDEALGNIVGGSDGSLLATHEEYSLITNKWAVVTSLGTATRALGGFAVGIYGYVNGGVTGGGLNGTAYKYNRLTKAWSGIGAVGTIVYYQGSYVSLAQEGYKVGGYNAAGDSVTVVESYNVDDNAWTVKTVLGTATADGAASSASYLGALWGGFTNPGGGMIQDVNQVYQFTGNSWTSKQVVPQTFGYNFNSGFTLSGILHAAGGRGSGASSLGVSYRYVPDNGHQAAQFLMFWQGVLFTAGDPDNPSRVLYTDLHKIRTQRFNAFMDMPLDRVTSMFKFQNVGYVLSRDGGVRIHGTTFDPDLSVGNQFIEEVPTLPGCVSHRSIVLLPSLGVAVWWSEDGPVLWDGSKAVKLAERYLNGEPRGLAKFFASSSDFSQGEMRYVIARHDAARGEVWWALTTTGTTKDDWYGYNYILDEFYGPTNVPMASAFEVEDLNTDLPILLGGDYLGKVFNLSTGNNYNGAAINGRYRTDFMVLSRLFELFKYDYLYTLAKQSGNYNLTMKTFRDWSATVDKTATENLNKTNKVLTTPIAGDNVNGLQIEWSNANVDEPFTVIRAEMGQAPAV